MHDMQRVAQLAAHFRVPGMLCINKFDLNLDQTQAMEDLAKNMQMSVMGRIPFDPVFIESMIRGQTILEYDKESEISFAVKQIWSKIINSPVMNGK